mgnify:CR=1 FL=1
MNDVQKNIASRRSCRSYKSEMVPMELIDQIIEDGLYAPSSLGEQSAIVIAVTDKAMRDKLSKLNAGFTKNPDGDPFYGAPVVLIVLSKKERPAQACDGSLMMQNMMLAAHSLGLATCWIHRAEQVMATEEGRAILADLGLDSDAYVGIANCILGYPAWDSVPAAPARKDGRVYKI